MTNTRWAAAFHLRVLAPILLLLVSLAIAPKPAFAQPWPTPPKLDTPRWALSDVTTGQILASANADQPIAPASLTKLMTAYVVFDALKAKKITLDQTFGTINAANLKRAHALLESGKSRGKIVLEGW